MNLNKKSIEIEAIDVLETEEESEVTINWKCNLGSGILKFSNDIYGNFKMSDEYMSKDFIMLVFEKLYDISKKTAE